jgi:hypothetical protein
MNSVFKHLDSLTPGDRETWVRATAKLVHDRFITKYLRGQLEHDGDLGSVPTGQLLLEMEDEAIDQLAYIQELRRRFLGLRATTSNEIIQYKLPYESK